MPTPPSIPQPKPKLFVTIIEDRYPREKYHTSLGQAKNAVSYDARGRGARGGTIWKVVADGEFELLYTVPEYTQHHNLPWNKKAES